MKIEELSEEEEMEEERGDNHEGERMRDEATSPLPLPPPSVAQPVSKSFILLINTV